MIIVYSTSDLGQVIYSIINLFSIYNNIANLNT